jgi:hypothetical protein
VTRYAVYYSPAPAHPLWRAGCAWLGRDPTTDDMPPAPAHRREPWRYGFHATLKAPMRLREGAAEADLLQALATLAQRLQPFAMPALRVRPLHDFLALRPTEPPVATHPLRELADACVRELDALRALPTAAELERAARRPLSPRQQAQLASVGYPHVFDDWRFHMTLSDALAAAQADTLAGLQREAEQHFAAALAVPLACDALSLFVEAAPGQPFRLQRRIALGRP